MCGIVGYIGQKSATPILLKGLQALEYRGYDSAGIATVTTKVKLSKQVGQVQNLIDSLGKSRDRAKLGIGHTRWATHGRPTKQNAHPHLSNSGRVVVVHNGIVENYQKIKDYLKDVGYHFKSETDTEAIANLIDYFLDQKDDFKVALVKTLRLIRGSYGLAVIDRDQSDRVYAARLSSPLIVGLAKDGNLLASDGGVLLEQTRKVIYLKDGEVALITANNVQLTDLKQQTIKPEFDRLEGGLTEVQKGDYPHFMLKEIFEAPTVIEATLQGRVKPKSGLVRLGGLESVAHLLRDVKRLIIVACGTSYYAGLVGERWLEELAQIPTEVQLASEFRYRQQPLAKDTVVLAISQSGETADTLAAVRQAKQAGLLCLGIVNSVGSSIARETDAGVYNHAGAEIGVASTKAYLSQLVVLAMIACYLCQAGNQSSQRLLSHLLGLPAKLKTILGHSQQLEKLADKYSAYRNFLFIGRGYNYPVALEGALKLKEVSYLQAEGYAAGEMKHGPIAMIDAKMPTIALIPKDSAYPKMLSNLEEIKARKGPILAVASEADQAIGAIARDVFFIPKTIDQLQPFLTVMPLQLLAYYIGLKRGLNVDKPRNLAKSVTVE